MGRILRARFPRHGHFSFAALSSTNSLRALALTVEEKEIFDILGAVVEQHRLDTEVRVAGGWVRNKLLGLDGGDIDIALTNMTGLEFAKLVKQMVRSSPHERFGADVESYLIRANPSQSKHLETAAVRLKGMWVDFVNMRSEVYLDAAGRIPECVFATPEEDAQRRDFTVNSLFYNIRDETVEDFTGCGMEDLRNSVLRTPPCRSTTTVLLEDPLRAYRAIRFAATYGFTIEKNLLASLDDGSVHSAVLSKISRERITGEIRKMYFLHPEKYIAGLELLGRTGLGPLLFDRPEISPVVDEGTVRGWWQQGCSLLTFVAQTVKSFDTGNTRGTNVHGISLTLACMASALPKEYFWSLPSFVASANDVVYMEGVFTGEHASGGESPYLKLEKIRSSNYFTLRHNKEKFFHPCIANKLPGVTKEVSSLGSLIFSGARTFPITVWEMISGSTSVDEQTNCNMTVAMSIVLWLQCFENSFLDHGTFSIDAAIAISCMIDADGDVVTARERYNTIQGFMAEQCVVDIAFRKEKSLVNGLEIMSVTEVQGPRIAKLKNIGEIWHLAHVIGKRDVAKETCLEFLKQLKEGEKNWV